jgi:hypothetical protein
MVGGTLLCIETDEHYHRYYKKGDEDARYHDVMLGHGGKLCFVRFNPDRFSREDEGPPLEERLERLHAEITRHIGRLERGENNSLLEVWYLYYPEGTPDFYDENTSPYLQEDYEETAPEEARARGACREGSHHVQARAPEARCTDRRLQWVSVSML